MVSNATEGLASRSGTTTVDAKLGKRAINVFGTKDQKIKLK